MKIVLQRVKNASVEIDGAVYASIDKGYVIFLGVGQFDTKTMVEKLVDKIQKLRIFPDNEGKSNLSISDVDGEILVISQFTLYADCKKGNRPSFTGAGSPELAEELYNYFIEISRIKFKNVRHGIFGADMKVSLINDGPFTIILEQEEILWLL